MANSLREMATSAKLRLKNGYWNEYYRLRDEDVRSARDKGINTGVVTNLYKKRLMKQLARHTLPLRGEDELYQKIYDIVTDSDTLVTDPIGRLIDREYYESLDIFNRQKYVLDLSNAYCTIKDEILSDLDYNSSLGK